MKMDVYRGQLSVTWKWLNGINNAVVAIRTDKPPAGPEDRDATCVRAHRVRGQAQGQFHQAVQKGVDCLYVAVFSAELAGTRWAYSPGSRRVLEVGRRRRLRFRIVGKGKLWPWLQPGEFELVLTPNAETMLPELVLVASEGGRPLAPEDGFPVLRTRPDEWCAPDQPLRIPLPPCSGRARCGVWMFTVREHDREWLEILPEDTDGYSIGWPRWSLDEGSNF